MGFEPRPPEYTSNALESRLPDAVCQRLYLYYTLYRIAVLFIETTHHI